MAQKAALKKIDALKSENLIADQQPRSMDVPIEVRRAAIRLADFPDEINDASVEHANAAEALIEVRETLDKNGRLFSATDHGKRKEKLRMVAEKASKQFDRKVSEDQIARILRDRDGSLKSPITHFALCARLK